MAEGGMEISKKCPDLCLGIKLYGKCNKPKCEGSRRHTFTEEELKSNAVIPRIKNGRVEVRILKCIDVNQYEGLVHNFYEYKSGIRANNISFLNILKRRHSSLNQFYEMEMNRVAVTDRSEGTLCAIQILEGEYEGFTRAKITGAVINSGTSTPTHYRIRCIDIGENHLRPAEELYELPLHFHNGLQTTVHVIIADIKPFGNEVAFQNQREKFVLRDKILTAPVALSVNDTVWVKSLYEYERGRTSEKDWIIKLNARNVFLRAKQVAEDNPIHTQVLYQLCEQKGLDCSVFQPPRVGAGFQKIHDPIQWAFLEPCSPENPVEVTMSTTYAISPDQIYAVHYKFEKLLDELNDKLNEAICELIEMEYRDYEQKFSNFYEKGLCVAARDFENRWGRAIVLNTKVGNNKSIKVDVFFVDHGDSGINLNLSEIFPIPKKFVEKLPFQAIALRLDHVESSTSSWVEAANDLLSDLLVKDGLPTKIEVVPLAKNFDKTTEHSILSNYYDAYVIGDKEMGEYLVEANLAKFRDGAFEKYEDVKKLLLEKVNAVCEETLASLAYNELSTMVESDVSPQENDLSAEVDVEKFDVCGFYD